MYSCIIWDAWDGGCGTCNGRCGMQNRAFMALVHATPTISHATPTISRATPTISHATPTLQNPTARVLSTQSRPKSKWRPLPLDTVVGVCTNNYITFIYCIAESFWGRKLLQILRLCGYSQKLSPQNLGAWCLFVAQASSLWKFSPQKSYFPPIHESFLPQKFSIIQY